MFKQRILNLQQILKEKNLDALFVSNFYNILYLTGCKTLSPDEKEAYVLITQENSYIFSDGRYEISLQDYLNEQQSPCAFKLFTPTKKLTDHLQEIIEEEGLKKVAFEGYDLSFNGYYGLKEKLKDIDFVSFDGKLLKLREIKNETEINVIKKACELTDECLEDIKTLIKVGVSEKEIAFKIEMWIKEKGYDLSFDPMVAVNENAALPHYDTKSGKGVIKEGSVVLIDMGIKYQDYCSDITRMFFVEKVSNEIKKAYEDLLEVQEATIKKINEVKELRELDEFSRESLINKGYPNMPHSLGHGVGLEVHEGPRLSKISTDFVTVGQVVTIEPGIYIPGKFGMRIEDTVAIRENNVEILTKFPKKIL